MNKDFIKYGVIIFSITLVFVGTYFIISKLTEDNSLEYEDFLKGETRYKSLIARDPELAQELFEGAKQNAKETYNYYKSLSEKTEY